ncbi:unnamed protein product [Rotaria sp. Silwood2]|nr:unnamed protein product [Rotaria sp. Silwood2]CAF3092747.1 unnamed protein product [Rotaria sp. Silwood2]CAF3264362.1 unnamed protein product [Rotaria sp. Silwood2]CAF4313517.1 unnamed protein product [Rotaria sp. Silwood2]CAF4492516.1 unnamed protein product [Rotaria sp. Silwood2]
MSFNRIFRSCSFRRLWFSMNHIRTVYTAQPESSPLQIYRNKVEAYELRFDSRQEQLMIILDKLYYDLQTYIPEPRHIETTTSVDDRKKNFLTTLTNAFKSSNSTNDFIERPNSLYIYGEQSLLMDIFFECMPIKEKRRVHFNGFMLEFHNRMHRIRSNNAAVTDNLLGSVVEELLDEIWLLCFDEFMVLDIGDAMIIKRLFEHLFAKGMIMIATSNRPPDDLYYRGLNREYFVPFIPFLYRMCTVYNMDSSTDYRLIGTQGHVQTVFDANLSETASELDSLCSRLIAPFEPQTATLDVNGRDITIAWQARGVVKFSFNELCGQEYYSADYIAIASTYHTLILTDIPKLSIEHRDRIRRFIILIDELYNYHTKLIISMFVHTVKDIFNPLKDNSHLKREDLLTMDEFHSFDRTISRLIEMQSKEYLAKPKRFSNKKNFLDEWSQLQ